MNSKSINRNVWALTLSLCLGVIFTHATGYAAEEDMGRPGHMPCPNPVNLTLTNVTALTANNGDFSAGQVAPPFAGLNDPGKNKHFMGTFRWDPPSKCCQITSGKLTVKMKSNSAGTFTGMPPKPGPDAANDGFNVMVGGTSVYNQSVYTPPHTTNFPISTPATVTWNLNAAALTSINGPNHRLSFYVQDDTMVITPGTTLQLSGCCLK